MRITQFGQWTGCLFCLLLSGISLADVPLATTIDAQVQLEKSAKQSQQVIDKLDDETAQLLTQYRQVLRQSESLEAYNNQLEKLVESQQNELTSISQQLDNISMTQRDIMPLILNMVRVLEQFIALDIPFLLEERQNRVAQLHELMERADVSLAEKYRRVLEAYQVETEYGRTIEAYQGQLELNGELRTVEFLRLGRVALYYLSLDGLQAAYWQQGWHELDSSYNADIDTALKMAKKQLPPDLLVLPMSAMGGER